MWGSSLRVLGCRGEVRGYLWESVWGECGEVRVLECGVGEGKGVGGRK